MIEIKFRAWNKELRRFVDKNELKHYAVTLDGKVINFDSSGYDYIEHFDILRYTGLKDKNGVEIYEGDIVESGIRDVEVVLFGEQEDREKYATYWGFNLWPDWEYEVIGNIYENPELLEAGL